LKQFWSQEHLCFCRTFSSSGDVNKFFFLFKNDLSINVLTNLVKVISWMTNSVQYYTVAVRANSGYGQNILSVQVDNWNEPFVCLAYNLGDLVLPRQDTWEDVIDLMFNHVIG
jgi:hypothetical protein